MFFSPYDHHDDSQDKEDHLGQDDDDHCHGEGHSLCIVDVPEECKKSVNLKMLKTDLYLLIYIISMPNKQDEVLKIY